MRLLDAAIVALHLGFRRRLVIACDGAGASAALINRLDELASRRGCRVS